MGMPAEVKRRWSADEARALQREDRAWPRYEVIDGELLVTPAPRPLHQLSIGALYIRLGAYLQGNHTVQLWLSPADIQLEPNSIVQPDIFVTPWSPSVPVRQWEQISSLVLAVEVLSPSSLRQDRSIKRRFYQRHGVPEYWVVDLDARQIERWQPNDARPEVLSDRLAWQAPGSETAFSIDLAEFFEQCCGSYDVGPNLSAGGE